jgi:hypothetical protein
MRGGIMASWARVTDHASGLPLSDPQLRDTRLELTAAILGRPITSTSEITRTEGLDLLRSINDIETGALLWAHDEDGHLGVWAAEPEADTP